MDRRAIVASLYRMPDPVGLVAIEKQHLCGFRDQLLPGRDFFHENSLPRKDKAVICRLLFRGQTSARRMTVQIVNRHQRAAKERVRL